MSGAFKKNPARRRGRQHELATSPGLGEPPAEWTYPGAEANGRCRALADLWREIIAQDVLRVLNPSHRMLVESTCYLMYKIRRAAMGYGKATSSDYGQVKSNLAAMGQTPIDSPRVAEAVRVPDHGEKAAARSGGWGELLG